MRVLVTESSGLIGSEIVSFFDARATVVVGIDNNMRTDFFGPEGDTLWNLQRLRRTTRHFRYHDGDVRDRVGVTSLFEEEGPFDDFDVNAVGTLNLLESTRRLSPEAVFVLMSTNKVYGDAPNELSLQGTLATLGLCAERGLCGVTEEMRTDRSKHSGGLGAPAAPAVARVPRRVFAIQVLVCDRCGGARRILGAVTEPPPCGGSSRRSAWLPSRRRSRCPPPDRLIRARSRPPTAAAVPVYLRTQRGGFRASPLRPPAALAGPASDALSFGRAAGGVPHAAMGRTGAEEERQKRG
jgi:hypothetical protein